MSGYRCHSLIAGLLALPASHLTAAEPRAPTDLFAACTGRFDAMAHHATDNRAEYAQRRAIFEELAASVRPADASVGTDPIELEAWAGIMVLLYHARYSFDATASEGAQRALNRALGECNRMVLG